MSSDDDIWGEMLDDPTAFGLNQKDFEAINQLSAKTIQRKTGLSRPEVNVVREAAASLASMSSSNLNTNPIVHSVARLPAPDQAAIGGMTIGQIAKAVDVTTNDARQIQEAARAPTGGKRPFYGRTESEIKKAIKKRSRKDRALSEIRKMQASEQLLLRRAPFIRLVREILNDVKITNHDYRVQGAALQGLQEAAEAFVVGYFEDAQMLSIHAKRITVMLPDWKLIGRLDPNIVGTTKY